MTSLLGALSPEEPTVRPPNCRDRTARPASLLTRSAPLARAAAFAQTKDAALAQRWASAAKVVAPLAREAAAAGLLAAAFAALPTARLAERPVAQLLQHLALAPLDRLLLGCALLTSADAAVAAAGGRVVRDHLGEALAALLAGTATVDAATAHRLVTTLTAPPAALGPVPADLLDALLGALRVRFPPSVAPPALAAVLHPAAALSGARAVPVTMGDVSAAATAAGANVSLARVMHELGYGCCANATVFNNLLTNFASATGRTVDEQEVGVALGMMARTQGAVDASGLPVLNDTRGGEGKDDAPAAWNLEIFFEGVRQVRPALNMVQVLSHLDHEGFYVADGKSLDVILHAWRLAGSGRFPMAALLAPWKHAEGQLSLIRAVLIHSPDLLNPAGDPALHSTLTLEDRDVRDARRRL